jgi:PhnB protein
MKAHFAPQLYIRNGTRDISFYERAFGAVELRRFSNDDGTIHVAEMSIDGSIFHLHESTSHSGRECPDKLGATTVLVGLFVSDVDGVVKNALTAGAKEIFPPTSFDYGFRQAEIEDPFGHRWLIEMKI